MTALLVFYGLLGLAAHVAEPPAVSPTHEVEAPVEHTHLEVPTSDEVVAADVEQHWLDLADCESGEWDADGNPIPGTARWGYGRPGGFTHEGFGQYHGGFNFHPDTWEWVASDLGLLGGYPHAYDAPPAVQVEVAAEVQARQGWEAWPVCSVRVGLR